MNWVLIFLGFSLLIILHEAGHFFAAKATGMRVEKFFLFLGPKLISIKRGDTEYGIAAIPLGGFVKITGMNPEEEIPPEVEHRAYYRQAVWRRIVTIAAGPAVNIVLAFLIFSFVYFVNAQQVTQSVGEVKADSPAAAVLKKGDKIVAIDGMSFRIMDQETRRKQFAAQVAAHKCPGKQVDGCVASTPARLQVERAGRMRTLEVRPRYSEAEERALVGFSYGVEPEDIGLGEAASRGWDSVWMVTTKTASIFSHIFESKQRKQISSVVGVSDAANQTINVGLYPTLLLVALVSLSLGLVNLLPILPLDGGHIFWALVEKLRGEAVSMRVIERATVVGFALVAVLMFVGLSNDIGHLGSEGIYAR